MTDPDDFNALMHPLTTAEKDELAKIIGMDPEAYRKFEEAYRASAMSDDAPGFMGRPSAKAAVEVNHTLTPGEMDDMMLHKADDVIERCVDELLCLHNCLPAPDGLVTQEEIAALPEIMRPQCTSTLMRVDIDAPSSLILAQTAKLAMEATDPKTAMHRYGEFRAMLETLDLDSLTYEMLGRNPNTMGFWFPALKAAVDRQKFFKVPETKIIKVPMPILQLSRLDYGLLTPATLRIVDEFCMKAFDLDTSKSYFIKTGVFSSKFDFRNAKVTGEKEVRELGEYLLYVTHLACGMASPLNTPIIYGAATTNEWVVREFIEDKENNPCIYHGMPLHTEYRFFVDFDTDEIIGVSPYWRPDVMKRRFSDGRDANTPDMIHDYIAYSAHENTLMTRYFENVERVAEAVDALIADVNLAGQWSLDIMQNGDDFYIIDMAQAANSALHDVVPPEKLKRLAPDIRAFLPAHEAESQNP